MMLARNPLSLTISPSIVNPLCRTLIARASVCAMCECMVGGRGVY